MSIFEPNNAGTVRFTNGSTAIVGVGTLFTSYKAGSVISIPGRGEMQLAADPTSDTAAVGQVAWQGTTIAAPGVAFQYIPRNEQATFSQKLTALLNQFANGNIQALVGISIAANKLIKGTGAGVLGVQDFAAWAQSMLALPGVANRLPYLDASNTAALAPLTSYARSILDDADAATARGTLGLSNVAYTDAANVFGQNQQLNRGITVARGEALDLWSPSAAWAMGTQGFIGHNGNNTLWIVGNGYRNSSGGTTTMGNNGSAFVTAIELSTNTNGVLIAMENAPAGVSPARQYRIGLNELRPETNDSKNLGLSTSRWSNIYLVNNPNVSSDERTKSTRGPLTAAEVAAGIEIGQAILIYQRLDRIAVEGDDARLHVGVSAQAVGAIMEAHGLDPARYSFWCADPLTRTETYEEPWTRPVETLVERKVPRTIPATEDAPEHIVEEVILVPEMVERTDMVEKEREVPILDEVGEPVIRLSIRYEQLAMFIAAAQAVHQDQLEARIAALEAA